MKLSELKNIKNNGFQVEQQINIDISSKVINGITCRFYNVHFYKEWQQFEFRIGDEVLSRLIEIFYLEPIK